MPGIRPVIHDPPAGGLASASRFPAAFRPPAFASRSSDTRRGVGPSSRSAYRTTGSDPDGVTTFRTHEQRPGWAPSDPGDGGALTDRGDYRPGICRFAAASPCAPPYFPSTGLLLNEASTRVHTIRPSGLPLACGRPDGTGRPWALASGFAPRRPRADDARRGGDRPSSTDLQLHAQLTSVDLQSSSSLNACDLGSHVAVALVRSRTGRQTNAIVRTAALGAAVLAEIRVRRGSSDCRFQIDEPDCGASARRRGAFSLLAGRRRRDGFWIRVVWAG